MKKNAGHKGFHSTLTPNLSGAYAPILTPFTPDRRMIDYEAFHRHLTFLEQSGLAGVLLCGTNGEFDQLTVDERLSVVDTAISASTRLKLIVGGTVPDSPDGTFDFVKQLSEYAPHVTALLVSPPFYDAYTMGRVVPTKRVVEFYHELAAKQNRLPLMLYNVPSLPEGEMTAPVTAEIVAQLRDEFIIVGVKDSTAQLENINAYLNAKPGIKVLVGSDYIIRPGLDHGAVGSITACGNIFPKAVLSVYQAQSKQDQLDTQAELIQLRELLDSFPAKKVAIQKYLLTYLGIFPEKSPVRDRNKGLSQSERRKIIAKLSELAEGRSQDLRQMILSR
jgi:dihydrodipicolinate synthase/N-acetylneuraminate lyase